MKIKKIFNRIANVFMAFLMLFTTVNIAGIQPVFADSGSVTGKYAKEIVAENGIDVYLYEDGRLQTQNHQMLYLNEEKDEYRVFCLNKGLKARSGTLVKSISESELGQFKNKRQKLMLLNSFYNKGTISPLGTQGAIWSDAILENVYSTDTVKSEFNGLDDIMDDYMQVESGGIDPGTNRPITIWKVKDGMSDELTNLANFWRVINQTKTLNYEGDEFTGYAYNRVDGFLDAMYAGASATTRYELPDDFRSAMAAAYWIVTNRDGGNIGVSFWWNGDNRFQRWVGLAGLLTSGTPDVTYGTADANMTYSAKGKVNISLKKTDANNSKAMPGVKFILTWTDANGKDYEREITTNSSGSWTGSWEAIYSATKSSTKYWVQAKFPDGTFATEEELKSPALIEEIKDKDVANALKNGTAYNNEANATKAAKNEAYNAAYNAVKTLMQKNVTYTLRETNTIPGYYLYKAEGSTSVTWTGSKSIGTPSKGSYSGNSGSGGTVTSTVTIGRTGTISNVWNYPQTGQLTVSKKDYYTGTALSSGSATKTFTLYAEEDIIDPADKSVVVKAGTAIETKETGSDGSVTFNGSTNATFRDNYSCQGGHYHLLPGKYIVKEVKAPLKSNGTTTDTGYYLYQDGNKHVFTTHVTISQNASTQPHATTSYDLDEEATGTNIVGDNATNTAATNVPQKATLKLEKVDQGMYDYTGSAKDDNPAIVDKDGDGAQGDATRKGAVYGLYAAEDIKRPDGKGTQTYGVIRSSAFSSSEAGALYYDATDKSHFKDKSNYNKIYLTKGSDLTLKNATATKGTLIATAKTDENGEIEFNNLFNGKYYVQEISAPEGYTLNTDKYYYDATYTSDKDSIIQAIPYSTDSTFTNRATKENYKTSQEDSCKGLTFDTVIKRRVEVRKVVSDESESGSNVSPLAGIKFAVVLESDFQDLMAQYGDNYNTVRSILLYGKAGGSLGNTGSHTDTNSKGHQFTADNWTYDVITTDSMGYATTRYLPYGDYRIIELPEQFPGTIDSSEMGVADDLVVGRTTAINQSFDNVGSDGSVMPGMFEQVTKNGDGYNVSVANRLITVTDSYILGGHNNPSDAGDPNPGYGSGGWFTLNNPPYTAKLKVIKRDASTKEIVTTSPTSFKVITNQDITWQGTKFNKGDALSYSNNGEVTSIWTTVDGEGYVILPAPLPCGSYTVKEVDGPDGYYNNPNTSYTFVVNRNAVEAEYGENADTVVIDYYDHAQIVKVPTTKRGEVLIGISRDDSTGKVTFNYETKNIAGAVFNLYAAEDIKDPATGEVIVTEGTLVDTKTTTENGLTFDGAECPALYRYLTPNRQHGLLPGKYYFVEVQAPNGYVINGEEFGLTITPTGETEIEADFEHTGPIEEDSPSDETNNITNGRQKASAELYKKDATEGNPPIQGATFELITEEDIYDYTGQTKLLSKGDTIETQMTNSNGYAKFDADLPLGYNFKVIETRPAPGYVVDDVNGQFETVYKGQNTSHFVYTQNFINRPTSVVIEKIDAQTKEKIDGAVFSLYDTNHDLIDSWTQYKDVDKQFKGLVVGAQYTLVEEKAPEGYMLMEDKTFTVTNEWRQQIVAEDMPILGTIKVKKTGEALTGKTTDDDGNMTFQYENKPLSGVTIALYADADILSPDKSIDLETGEIKVLYKKGTKIAEKVTDKSGVAEFTDLPLGDYYVQEIKTIDGYTLNSNKYRKSITQQDFDEQTQTIEIAEIDIDNKRQTVDIETVKKDTESQEALAGAKIGIKADEPIVAYDGTVLVNEGETIEIVETSSSKGEEGKASFTDTLPMSEYIVYEVDAPEGYYKSDKEYYVNTYRIDNETEKFEFSAEFEDKETEIRIYKRDDDTDVDLSNVTFRLYEGTREEVESGSENAKLIEVFTTNSEVEDYHTVRGLKVNTVYTLVETDTKTGYILTEPFEFTTSYLSDSYSQEYQSVYLYNKAQKGNITVHKDAETLDSIETVSQSVQIGDEIKDGYNFGYAKGDMADATFEIYAAEDIKNPDGKSEDYFKKDELVGTITTDESDGSATLYDLPLGNYYAIETEAPAGTIINKERHDIALNYAGETVSVSEAEITVTNERPHVRVNVAKTDTTSANKPVAKAGFTIFNKNAITIGDDTLEADTPLQTVFTNEAGNGTFTIDLPLNQQFYIKETVAPEGYTLTSEVYNFATNYTDENTETYQYSHSFKDNTTYVQISKQDISGVEIPGAKLKILDSAGHVVESWTSGTEAHVVYGLTVGEIYTLQETLAPNGFLNAQEIKFVLVDNADAGNTVKIVNEDGTLSDVLENNTVVMIDQQQKAKIEVSKVGEALTSTTVDEQGNTVFTWTKQPLKGATFKVIALENIKNPASSNSYYYHQGDIVAELTTGEDGKAITDELPLGKYRVIETQAPDDYFNNEDNYEDITLSYQGANGEVVFTKSFEFENARQKASIKAIKKDAETEVGVAGAEFTLYTDEDIVDYHGNTVKKAGDMIEVGVTDENGVLTFKADLPNVKYHIEETKAPDGYHSTDVQREVDASFDESKGQTVEYEAVITNHETEVEISKQDITTQVETAGNYLQVFDDQGQLVDEWVSELGKSHIITKLTVGKEYTLVERLAATGYLKAQDIKFVVEDYGDEFKVQEIQVMYDELVKGQIYVEKQGDVLTGITKAEDGTIDFVYEKRALKGAIYEIYAAEDIKHPDGVSEDFYKKDDLVDTVTTGDRGTATSKELPLGKYYLVETQAPDGFVLNPERYEAELTYKDQYTEIVTDEVTALNEKQNVEITAIKQDKETHEYLEGAEFTLYNTEDIRNADGEVILEANTPIQVITTGKDGKAKFTVNLPLGNYVVKETKPPKGYATNEANKTVGITVDASYKGQTITVISSEVGFENAPITFEFSKTDITDQSEIVGATLTVYEADKDGHADKDKIVDTWVSTTIPHIIKGLEVGKSYVMVEENPANGYVTADDIVFTVIDTETIQKVNMVDDITKVTIDKTDITDGKPVENATLTIYKADNDGNIIDEDNPVTSWVTGGEPHYIERLPIGDYVLRETRAPGEDGYVTAEDVKFSVLDTGEIQKVSMKDDHTRTSLTKVDTDSKPVAGALMQIVTVKADGTPNYDDVKYEWTTGDEPHVIEYIPTGKYFLVEVKAPEGYVKAKPVQFEIKDTAEVQAVELVEKQVSFSKTDVTGQKELPGAEMEVVDETGNIVDKWTSNTEEHMISGLEEGKEYTLREITAPDGYVVAEEIKFTVTTDKKDQHIEMKDKQVFFTKTDITGEKEVPGAEIVVKDSKGEVVDSWTSTDEPHAIKGLKENETYTLEEITAPDGYVKAESITFTVTDDKVNQNVTMQDKQVFFTKTDITGEEELEGAHMIVTDKETGEIVDEWVSEKEPHAINNLEEGKTYILTETQAPDGYVISESIEFEVTFDKENQNVEMKDKRVAFNKTDVDERLIPGAHIVITDKETGKVVDEFDTTNEPHFINGLVEGRTYVVTETVAPDGYVKANTMEFTVSTEKADETVTLKDKQVFFTKADIGGKEVPGAHLVVTDEEGNVVDEWTSTTEEHIIKNLEEGKKYTLTETQAPDGYVLSESIEFEVTTDKENQHVQMIDKQVAFTKTDVTGEKELAGAHIIVTDKDGNTVDEWTSSEEPHYISGLVEGEEYTLTETIAPDGYVIAESIKFTVSHDKETQLVEMKDKRVEFTKTDVTGEAEIPGAHIVVTDKETGQIVDEFDSTEESHYIKGLTEGRTYILTETVAPDEYSKAQSIEFTVSKEKVDEKVSMKDKQVIFTKTDVAGEEVPGAHITVKDEDGNIVDEWVSTEEEHPIKGLEEGKKYTLTETQAPDGYVVAETIEFEVTFDKEIQRVEMVDKRVSVSKQDIVSKKELPGAKLQITDKDGNVVEEWTSGETPHYVSGLKENETYYLTEITAPNGYEIAETIEFKVTNEKVDQEIVMYDAPYTAIQVNKVDAATKKPVISKDFEFTMYADAECTQVIRTVNANTKDGTATFDKVGFGTYYIKETKAPQGYLLSDEVKKIVVDENLEGVGKVHSFIYENTLNPVSIDFPSDKKKDNPKTGDSIMPFVAGTVMIVAVTGIVAVYVFKRKKNDEE